VIEAMEMKKALGLSPNRPGFTIANGLSINTHNRLQFFG
jgi:hypothetical protein